MRRFNVENLCIPSIFSVDKGYDIARIETCPHNGRPRISANVLASKATRRRHRHLVAIAMAGGDGVAETAMGMAAATAAATAVVIRTFRVRVVRAPSRHVQPHVSFYITTGASFLR